MATAKKTPGKKAKAIRSTPTPSKKPVKKASRKQAVDAPLERIKKIVPGLEEKTAKIVIGQKYESAQQIAAGSRADFRNAMYGTGVDSKTVDAIYDNAVNVRQWLDNLRAAYVLPQGPSEALGSKKTAAAAGDAFNEEISYSNLFPGTGFCDCDPCTSGQSPAAFFCTLMEITETYVKVASGAPSKLSLKERRKDLWTLPLTCDNATIENPYLQIVNRILTDYLALAPAPVTWETIASGKSRFVPYNQPNQHIRSVLAAAGTSLGHVATTFSRGDRGSKAWAYETLGLSASDVRVLYQPGELPPDNISPSSFLEITGLDPDDLWVLVYQHLSPAELGVPGAAIQSRLFINSRQSKASKPLNYIKGDSSGAARFENMEQATLKQVRSFLILASSTGWDYTELNQVLSSLSIAGFDSHASTDDALQQLARVKYIADSLSLTPLQVVCCTGNIPTTGVGDDLFPVAPFDRLFNAHLLLQQQGKAGEPYHPLFEDNPLYTSAVINWPIKLAKSSETMAKLAGMVTGDEQHQTEQVLSGIGCSALEAMLMAYNFRLPLLTVSGNVFLELTVPNLSVLYAHALAAGRLGLPVALYVELYNLRYPPDTPKSVRRINLDILFDLSCLKDQLAAVAVPLADYISVLGIAKKIANSTVASKDLVDFTEQVRKKLEATRKASEDPASPRAKLELEEIIYKQWVHELSVFLAIPENWIYSLANGLYTAGDPAALNHYIEDNPPGKVALAFQGLVPHLLFIQKARLSDRQVEFTYSHIIPATKGDLLLPDIAGGKNIDHVLAMKRLLSPYSAEQAEKFIALLSGSGYFDEDFLTTLESITGWHSAAVKTLKDRFHEGVVGGLAVCIALLLQIQECFVLAEETRLDTLRLLVLGELVVSQSGWDNFLALSDQLESIIRSKFSQEEWQSKFRKSWGDQLERDRDILLPVAIAVLKRAFPDISSSDHVADYFLCDVSMGGQMDVSRLREAMDAVQTYLQRCRIGLEKIDLAVLQMIPPSWWEWIGSYRLWQANQKILQYPEDYLQAGLRANETASFKELKEALQQQDINSATIDTAFKKYLDQWCDLGNITIVDISQYNVYDAALGRESPKLFVFGRNEGDAETYYYTTEDEFGNWDQWKKIDVKIKSDMVNSVYVFNRLFVFWTEQTILTSNDITDKTAKYSMYSLSIKYTCQDLNGSWSTPATLKEFPFYLDLSPKSELLKPKDGWSQFSRHFKPELRIWKKLSLTPVTVTRPGDVKQDFLMLFLGPLILGPRKKTDWDFRPAKADNIGIAPFDSFIAFMNECYDKIMPEPIEQYYFVPAITPIILDADLRFSYLFDRNERYYYMKNSNPFGTYITGTMGNTVGVYPAVNFIGNNYNGSLFVPNAAEDRLILNILNHGSYVEKDPVHTVRNLPMAFWINTTQGALLFRNTPDKHFDPVVHLPNSAIVWGNVHIQNHTPQHFTDKSEFEFTITRITSLAAQFLRKEVFDKGIEGCLNLPAQQAPKLPGFDFKDVIGILEKYKSSIKIPRITSNAQVEFKGPYGLYAWELFFYAPSLMASIFTKNLQYDEAQAWWQYIFNPVGKTLADRKKAWIFLPFYENDDNSTAQLADEIGKLAELNADPFDPDFIAQIRHSAYMKWTVIQYLDNLIGWGDQHFSTETWEGLSAATLLYFEAEDLLGKKPDNSACELAASAASDGFDFEDVYRQLHEPPSAFEIGQENEMPVVQALPCTALPAVLPPEYFCKLPNQQLEAFWSAVRARLYKLRHGLNLAGEAATPSLYGSTLNPLDIASTGAVGGVSPGSSSALTTEVPLYRFKTVFQNALNMADMASGLGTQLLTALQQHDAEGLQLMQATQLAVLTNMVTQSLEQTMNEAQSEIGALQANLESATYSRNYYSQLLKTGLILPEITNIGFYTGSIALNAASALIKLDSAFGYAIPTIFGLADGGFEPGSVIEAVANALDSTTQMMQTQAMLSGAIAEYERRGQEWSNQVQLANYTIDQINNQLTAAMTRLEISRLNYAQNLTSTQQAADVQNYLSRKFTNVELYSWMSGQIASLYFDAFQVALELSFMAQKCYQYELCREQTFIPASNWDSLRKGLLAGEKLKLALMQMQKSFIQFNKRGMEVEKMFSVKAKIENADKNAWTGFKQNGGTLTFNITKDDLKIDSLPDNGNSLVIKLIRVSIPAVVGPYQTFGAVLTQTKQSRKESETNNFGQENQKVVISGGIDDSGLLVVDFNDERYLPFEGTGAISTWEFTLKAPAITCNISDIIFTMRYVVMQGDEQGRK
ncbi:MAG: hypothetical protein JST87_04695 [Bacteroidetes bacterium]|nr:hypothetical protein [Bacteroidota bacterium]